MACGRLGFDRRSGQTKVIKSVGDGSTAQRSAIGVSVTVPRDDHYKGLARVTVDVARQNPLLRDGHERRAKLGQNLQPFTDNDDVDLQMSEYNSRMQCKTSNKHTSIN